MSDSAQQCLRKTSAIVRYIPPANPQEPTDCKTVTFIKDPEIRIFTGQRSVLEGRPSDELIGLDYLCSVLSLEGAGGIILLLQVGTYIEWEVGFRTKQNTYVTELHRLFVSLPVMFKISGPQILLSRWLPMWMRLGHYAASIWAGLRKIDELQEMLGTVALLKTGVCPDDIKTLKESLRKIEEEMNKLLRRAAESAAPEGELARLMHGRAPGSVQIA